MMIYSITNEQPFQVLSTNFSVSPSESGYNLQISANGIDYTDFATVGAGVTRQFTGMANGNFYRLSGNTGTVEVNWMRECSPAGGGGTAGVSSLDGQTGALTTKTIGGQSILGTGDIPVGGGKIAVDLDNTSQADLATLYTQLWAVSGTVNELYEFYCTFTGATISNNTPIQVQAQLFSASDYGGSIFFCGASSLRSSTNKLITYRVILLADGSLVDKGAKSTSLDLPKASSSTLGGVKVGNGLSIDSNGVLSVSGGGSNVYYVDGDNINSYSGIVEEIYHKLSSGETAYATVKCDYAKYPVAKAEIYEYQEGQPGDPDYLRKEGFQIIATRFGSDGYAIRSGIVRAFRYEGRDGNGYSCGQSWDYAMPEVSGGNYVIVDALSAITNPTEGMVAFVKGTIAVDRLANVSGYKLSGWAGGMAQFVEGEDYTINRSQVDTKWSFTYKAGTPSFTYYWTELDPGVYIRYQGGNLWVAWNSEKYPNASMMGNNFTDSDNKWGETSGQTFYITLDHSEGFNQYRNGKWVPMKKQYWFQDCISSSALSEEICHRTAEGEMDITLVENDGVMTCQYSSPNSWNVGSTAFIMFKVDTSSNHLQYFRKFVNWDSYNWAQDAAWDYTLPQSSGLHTKPIFRDYWYVYYDTTTSGFSYGIDQTLTPITWGTGTTCSGMLIFDKDGTYQYLGTPTDVDKAFFFNLRVKTSEGTRIYGYPSFSRVVLDTPVTLTNEQSESITFSDKVYFDYGDCVLSFYFNNDWRFGGIEINFR